jgi:5-methylcytosine-specific restriction endonuclease McrA
MEDMPEDSEVRRCPEGHAKKWNASRREYRCPECARAYAAQRRAEIRAGTRVSVKRAPHDPAKYPCGHPRTPENAKAGNAACLECHRLREAARHEAKLAAAGKQKRVYDPDWFPCGHPRIAGNLTATKSRCRVCHIDRATKSYRENGAGGRGNPEALRERNRAYKQCMREERADPETTAYLRIIRCDLCAYCGGPGGTRDHIVPISEGGANHWSNYTGACLTCNIAKSDSPLLTFLLDRMVMQQIRQAGAA